MPQIHYPPGPDRYITVTYQSNTYLNEILDNKVKPKIAKAIFEATTVEELYSYVHGQIIARIANDKAVTKLKAIVAALNEPMASEAPSLLFSVDIAAQWKPRVNSDDLESLIYVEGDSEMNEHFLDSIKDFYPKKTK